MRFGQQRLVFYGLSCNPQINFNMDDYFSLVPTLGEARLVPTLGEAQSIQQKPGIL